MFGNDHEEESYLLPAKEDEGANDDGSEDAGEDEEEDDEPVLRFAIHPWDVYHSHSFKCPSIDSSAICSRLDFIFKNSR